MWRSTASARGMNSNGNAHTCPALLASGRPDGGDPLSRDDKREKSGHHGHHFRLASKLDFIWTPGRHFVGAQIRVSV